MLEFIRYKRKTDEYNELVWDQMVDGHASALKEIYNLKSGVGKAILKGIGAFILNYVLAIIAVGIISSNVSFDSVTALSKVLDVAAKIILIGVPLATFILFGLMKKIVKKRHWLFMFAATIVVVGVLTLLLSGLTWLAK